MAALPTLYEYYTSGGITAGLSADQPYFTLNNKNITIFSGAMHYFRVPPEYWRDRLRKMKAAGLNAVETYVPWNLHNPSPDLFDFGDGGTDFQEFLNIERFLKTAQEEDLLALVRPGPYICSEFEFGGMPSWLLREKGMRLRTSDEKFVGYAEKFFKALFLILTSLQFTKGGPIIAFQIENEYGGTFNTDLEYLTSLKNIMENNGIVELLYTSDGPAFGTAGAIPGVLQTGNFQDDVKNQLTVLQSLQPDKPVMTMEYWTGWFDHWTENHHTRSNELFANNLEAIISFPSSVNMYMFHGGTNWGFLNGANLGLSGADNRGLQPDTSSYDYDAPLSEAGDYTDKYESVVEIVAKYNEVKTQLPERPEPTPKVQYDDIEIVGQLSLSDLIDQSQVINSENLLSMEDLDINENGGQSFGYIVYRKTNLKIPANSVLKIEGSVHDEVQVLINGELKSGILESAEDLDGFGYWKQTDTILELGSEAYDDATLDLVVMNFGRANYGTIDQFYQPKGLVEGDVFINDEALKDWQIVPLEFKKKWNTELEGWSEPSFSTGPALYRAVLNVLVPQDTFVDMSEWNQGITIVNGFVLSRHFHLGPQQTQYLPAPFLKRGDNEILIFEHFVPAKNVKFSETPIFHTK